MPEQKYEAVIERPTLPRDLDPAYFDTISHRVEGLKKVDPGFLLGTYMNPRRGGEEVHLIDRSDRFLGVFMPTRSGKGVSFAFPNALTFEHSLFLNDPKRELCEGTAWWRRHALGQRIFIVDPMASDGRNARFNALSEVRIRTIHEIQDTLNTAQAIVDPDGSGFEGESGVWKKRARDLLAAVILHILYSPQYKEKSLRTCVNFLVDPGKPIKAKFDEMRSACHDPANIFGWRNQITGEPTRTHYFVATRAQEQLDRPDAEAGSVKSEVQSYLNIYSDDYKLGANSAESDFAIADIMHSQVPTTVYLTTTPDNLETCRPYIRLFLNLLINRNVGPMSFDKETARPLPTSPWKLGMLLDEFTSTLGNLQIFSKQLAFIAGYRLKPAIIVQDMQQIKQTYGQYENITSNLHTVIFGAMNNLSSAEHFSKLLGNRTAHYETKTRSSGRTNKSVHVESIPLLSPTQIMRMPREECIVRMAHMQPVPLKKLVYYDEDSNFSHRVKKIDFASDRIPPELQTGYQERLAQERELLDLARSRMRDTIVVTSSDAERRQILKSADPFGDLVSQLHQRVNHPQPSDTEDADAF